MVRDITTSALQRAAVHLLEQVCTSAKFGTQVPHSLPFGACTGMQQPAADRNAHCLKAQLGGHLYLAFADVVNEGKVGNVDIV